MNVPAGRLMPADLVEAPIPDIVEALMARRAAKRRGAMLAERSMLLTPFVLLAACGGGGGGGGGSGPGNIPAPPPGGTPTPTPPGGTPTITSQADAIAATAGGANVTGNVLANDTTSSGTLTVSAVAIQGGNAGTVGQAMQGTLGSLTINGDGSFTFTVANNAAVQALAAGQTGTNVFTYTPAAGATAGTAQTVTVTVTGVNDAPVAVADTASITEDAAVNTVSGNVRTNDTDPDAGATLTVSAVAGGTVGQTVQGTYGSVVINADGTYTYTLDNSRAATNALNTGQTGTDTFTYTISDGTATSSSTLTITVNGNTDAAGGGGGGGGGGGQGPTSIDLGALGSGGATLTAPGSLTGAQFGFAIATVQPGGTSDVTGDGRADLIVAAPFGAGGTGAGRVFVYSGADLSAPARTLNGAQNGDRFGFEVGVGNVGGNAQADVLVGAPGTQDGLLNAGRVYAFFGESAVVNASANPSGANGFTLTINSGEGTAAYPQAGVDIGPNLGAAVAVLGDINGDGRNDFFVSLPGLNIGATQDIGEAYVGFGQASYAGTTIGVGSLANTTLGFRVQGQQVTDGEGYTAAASGDVNGTGGADLVLADARGGVVAIRFNNAGPTGSVTTNNADLNGANGVRLVSNDANARFGESIAVGDINGDGRADVIVGAPGVSKVYVLLGAASYASGTIDVANPGSASVIEISGTGGFGASVAFIGNFNGDARGDFVVGAPTDGANGSAYIILGSATPSASAFNLATSGNVIKLSGGAPGTGAEVAGPGDLNGDGLADVAIAAVNGTTNANGTVYVVYGRSSQASSAVSQEAVAMDDGSNDLFGGSQTSAGAIVDLISQTNDIPPPMQIV